MLLCTSCSLWVDTGRQQCSKDSDCTGRGAAFANSTCVESLCTLPTKWSCLGSVTWPSAGTGTVTATLNLKDIITNDAIPGVSGRLCRKLDVACATPLVSGLLSDAQGKLVVDAPAGFDGYVELQSTNAIPGMYFFYPPLAASREIPFVPILPLAELTAFAQVIGSDLVPDRGQILAGAYDCFRNPAEGVTFSSLDADEWSTPFYMIKEMPSITATATDSSGYGGILNFPPGSVGFSGQLATGAVIGTESLLVRANQITYTALPPMPQ